MGISRETIHAVRARANIVDVIGEYVQLKPKGGRFWGCCPFHQEKTPSFTVSPDRNAYWCFGSCQSGGDVIDFLRAYQGIDFTEAVRELADRYGIPVEEDRQSHAPAEQSAQAARRRQLLELMARAQVFFARRLPLSPEAQHYASEVRGLSQDTLDTFGIGYAPPQGDALAVACEQQGVDLSLLEECGLLLPSTRRQGTWYDRFKNRLMFPVHDKSGRVIAFSGRIIPGPGSEEQAKYINSPETPIYRKGDHLFGLAMARTEIRHRGYAILVEGNVDQVMLYDRGFKHTVAVLGTAFTEHQARVLRGLCDRVIVAFDSDDAGRKATLKSIEHLLAQGFDARIIQIPQGKDPDEFIRIHGSKAFQDLLDNAQPILKFAVDIKAEAVVTDAQRARLIEEIQPWFKSIKSAVEADGLVEHVALRLQLDATKVRQYLAVDKSVVVHEQGAVTVDRAWPPDHFLAALLIQNAEALQSRATSGGALDSMADPQLRQHLLSVLACRASHPDWPLVSVLSELQDLAVRQFFLELAQHDLNIDSADLDAVFSTAVDRTRQQHLIQMANATQDEIARIQRGGYSLDDPGLRSALQAKLEQRRLQFAAGPASATSSAVNAISAKEEPHER